MRLRNAVHAKDQSPLDPECACVACQRYTRSYLRHLFVAGEMLGPILASLHNITYYQTLVRQIRQAVMSGTLQQFRAAQLARWSSGH